MIVSLLISDLTNDLRMLIEGDQHHADVLFVRLFLKKINKTHQQNTKHSAQVTTMAGHVPCEEIKVKLILIGEVGVGKTTFAMKSESGLFIPDLQQTIGTSIHSHSCSTAHEGESPSSSVKFVIWDTACSDKYFAPSPMFYRNADAALIMYDVTSAVSLQKAKDFWIERVQHFTPDHTLMALVGHKCDLEGLRQVSTVQGHELADREGLEFFETSAKIDLSVNALFLRLSELLLAHGLEERIKHRDAASKPSICSIS